MHKDRAFIRLHKNCQTTKKVSKLTEICLHFKLNFMKTNQKNGYSFIHSAFFAF